MFGFNAKVAVAPLDVLVIDPVWKGVDVFFFTESSNTAFPNFGCW